MIAPLSEDPVLFLMLLMVIAGASVLFLWMALK